MSEQENVEVITRIYEAFGKATSSFTTPRWPRRSARTLYSGNSSAARVRSMRSKLA